MKNASRAETRNVTVALPVTLLKKVKRLAVEKDSSISGLLTATLERIVDEADEYERARKREIARMRKGYDLGTYGKITWTREELHERR
ncbi:MAG TPA: CopG family transcriptional regulator [Thermoanaerobaculia bacterium]|nr:CopG family transcriptional regulator [Thermoanaerobaculia bacterium]